MVAPYKVIAVEFIASMGALVIAGMATGIIPVDIDSGVVLGILAVLGAAILVDPFPDQGR